MWSVLACVAVGGFGGYSAGVLLIKYPHRFLHMLPAMFGGALLAQLGIYFFEPPFLNFVTWVVAHVVGLLLAGFFGGGGWKRFKAKTSAAKEKLLAKVRELAPVPQPIPVST